MPYGLLRSWNLDLLNVLADKTVMLDGAEIDPVAHAGRGCWSQYKSGLSISELFTA